MDNARYVLEHPDEFDLADARKEIFEFENKANTASQKRLAADAEPATVSESIRNYIKDGETLLAKLESSIEQCERDFDQCSSVMPEAEFLKFEYPVRAGSPSRLKEPLVIQVNMTGVFNGIAHYNLNSPIITPLGKCDWNEIKYISLRGQVIYNPAGAADRWNSDHSFSISFTDIEDGTMVRTMPLDTGSAIPWPPGTNAKVSLTYLQSPGYAYGPITDRIRLDTYRVYIH